MGREFELKYAATPQQQAAILTHFSNWENTAMETTYFDTADGSLSRKNCTLRRRMENGISVCTLKTPAAGFGRGEWDVEAPWCRDTTQKLFADAGLSPISFKNLVMVCGARFIRHAKVVELENCTVEIAVDAGILLGGSREIPLCEVEVEVKSGDEAAATQWAQAFAAQFGLQPEHRSKFSRAAALARGE